MSVLKDISLEVFDGEFLGIVGPNAGGKSTLLKLILGQLQPRSGKINVLGDTSCNKRHRIGYVSQYPSFPRDFPVICSALFTAPFAQETPIKTDISLAAILNLA